MALMQSLPNQAPIIAPIMVRNMDIPGAQEIAKLLQKTLPPQFQDEDENGGNSPEALQAQVQQLSTMLQQQGQLLQQQHQMLEGKMLEQQTKKEIEMARIQADMATEKLKAETQLAVAQMNSSKDANQAIADDEMEKIGMAHDAAHELAMAKVDHEHTMQQQQQAHTQALEQGQQQQQAAAAQQSNQIAADQQAAQSQEGDNE
jgi:hypothetical protein